MSEAEKFKIVDLLLVVVFLKRKIKIRCIDWERWQLWLLRINRCHIFAWNIAWICIPRIRISRIRISWIGVGRVLVTWVGISRICVARIGIAWIRVVRIAVGLILRVIGTSCLVGIVMNVWLSLIHI